MSLPSPDTCRSRHPAASPLRVHVISPEPVVRAGMLCLLSAHDPTLEFVDDPTNDTVDVVLYDVIGLRLHAGHDLAAAVTRYPGRVLAVSRTLRPELTSRARDLGAIGAVSLGADPAELVAAIYGVVDGQFRDSGSDQHRNRADRSERDESRAGLSPREHQVLSHIVAGASNDEIAANLYITLNTVKSCIRGAYRKIGVNTRAQAVAWGVSHGFPTHGGVP